MSANWRGEKLGKLKKRRRRSRSEIQKIRDHFLGALLEEGKISLDQLAREGALELRRDGRDLVARAGGNGQPTAAAAPVAETRHTADDLDVIRAFARQLEEFSRTLQDQISTLVRMVEKAAR